MLRSGDWSTITLNGYRNDEFPPLFIWVEAASMGVFGSTDQAAKFPAALAGFLTAFLLYCLTVELTGDRDLAFLSMALLATTQTFTKYAGHAMTDVPFTLIVTATFYFYFLALRRPWFWLAFGSALGLGLLTRSVIGFFPLGATAVHWVIIRRRMLPWPFLLAAAAGSMPFLWWLGTAGSFHLAFLTTKIGDASNPRPWEYLWIVPRYFLPWIPLVFLGAYQYGKISWADRKRPLAFFAFLWPVALLLPLSFAATKYARYAIPAFPAFALLAAYGLAKLLKASWRPRAAPVACGVLAMVIAVVGLFPAKDRALTIRPFAERCGSHFDRTHRVVMYLADEFQFDLYNQFLWYGDRYVQFTFDQKAAATATLDPEQPRPRTLVVGHRGWDH